MTEKQEQPSIDEMLSHIKFVIEDGLGKSPDAVRATEYIEKLREYFPSDNKQENSIVYDALIFDDKKRIVFNKVATHQEVCDFAASLQPHYRYRGLYSLNLETCRMSEINPQHLIDDMTSYIAHIVKK